jgi:sirohydrochlorin ferrochelatase
MRPEKLDRDTLAVVLIAHGSRNADANADALYFAEQLKRQGVAQHVQAAFLELAEPTIACAVDSCLKIGSKTIVLLPYFLSAGVHVRRDLMGMCEQFGEANQGVEFILAEPLGRHPQITEVLKERMRDVLMRRGIT